MHKNVLSKSINVLIAKSITLICLQFAFPQAVGSDCILLDLKCRAASDNNNQNSLYYFIRNAHLTIVTLHIVLY